MTVPDVIKQLFREHGLTDFDEALSGNYRTWEYLVQYRETAFNFISRMMEQEGMYYFFKHEDGKHTLVLADSYSAHRSEPRVTPRCRITRRSRPSAASATTSTTSACRA